MRRALWLAPLLAGACGGGTMMGGVPGSDAPPLFASAQPIALQNTPWNVNAADVGKVAAITEIGTDVVVYADKGAFVLSGGAVSASDPTITAWHGAATIGAADNSGDWAVGLDARGRLFRLRARMVVEDVTDRYGLLEDPVAALARLDGVSIGFALASQLAISDGTSVARFDDRLSAVAGGSGRFAGIAADGSVHLIDPHLMTRTVYPIADAVGVAFGLDGKLVIAARHTLYREAVGALTLLYRDPATTFHGVTASGPWVWAAAGADLVGLKDSALYRTSGLGIDAAAALGPSQSGDAWVLAGGQLARFAAPVQNADEGAWRASMLPIYARTCSSCHAPGGTSGFPLASYDQWVAMRSLIYQRVVVKGDMPQGRTISDADKMAIATWTAMK